MANISQITIDNNTFDIKDTQARNNLDGKQDILTPGQNISITKDTTTGETVISATGGGTQIKLSDVSGAAYTTNKRTISLTWSDPDDVEISGVVLAQWAGTKVVRKIGSAPANSTDGTIIEDSTTKNAYSSTALVDNTVEYGNIYYYRFFPYTVDGVTTSGSTLSVTPARTVITTVPSQSGTLTYDGTEQTASWSNYEATQLDISGDTEAILNGTYTATFTPKVDYEWSDGSRAGKNVNWTIGAIIIATIPSQSGTITYNGAEKTASWSNYDSTQLTVTGDTATNAGTYTASFTPKVGHTWSDTTTTAKTADWVIDKADADATLSSDTVTLDEDHTSTTVTVTNATGEVSVSSGNMALATATYDSSTGIITITSPNQKSGTVTITVTIAEVSNYNEGTKSITVSCKYVPEKDWKDGANKGTDEEIAAMIEAADNGDIDLSLYWAVNDKRTVHLSAMIAGDGLNTAQPEQDVVLVLMDTGANSGYKDVNGKPVNFVWGQENSLSEYGRMNTTDTNTGSWNGCAMRTDLNSKYYNALPAEFRACFKQFNVITAQTYNGSTNQTSQDYISLFAAKEVFGSQSYSNSTEAAALSQIKYYETSSNRIKQAKGSNYYWWERSPRSSYAGYFCSVTSDGNADYYPANYAYGVAPFGCI